MTVGEFDHVTIGTSGPGCRRPGMTDAGCTPRDVPRNPVRRIRAAGSSGPDFGGSR